MQPFNISTPDGELLYAWHILPVAVYSKHQGALAKAPEGPPEDVTLSTAFELLVNDPESRLVIYCLFTFLSVGPPP